MLIFTFVVFVCPEEVSAQYDIDLYAFISIENKDLSKKAKVKVDFGDTPDQVKIGKVYSEILSEKKTYAAILNFMVEDQFEFVETIDLANISKGTIGLVFVMKKKKSLMMKMSSVD